MASATGNQVIGPILQFFANDGAPFVGGLLSTSVGGVATAVYGDQALTQPLPNPIVLNSRGEVATSDGTSSQIFMQPGIVYQFVLTDANNNPVWTAPSVMSGFGLAAGTGISISTTGGVTTITNTLSVASALAAGTGITLQTASGITTISANPAATTPPPQIITLNTVYTPTVTGQYLVMLIGGGGGGGGGSGGGGSSGGLGSPGGAGGGMQFSLLNLTALTGYPIGIGAAGNGGAGGSAGLSGLSGTSGTATTFAALLTASGGTGGGGNDMSFPSGENTPSCGTAGGGNGGGAGGTSSTPTGGDGNSPGAGGGGGAGGAVNGAGGTGGNGAPGLCVIFGIL